MEFTVPQFIEREPKIIGPFTFKQFVFIFLAGGICLFLYFTIAEKNFGLFLFAAIFLLGGALALAFVKIGKTPLPIFIKNMFIYLFGPKIYLWKRKIVLPKIRPVEKTKETTEEKSSLKVAGRSKLKQLFTRLEAKNK